MHSTFFQFSGIIVLLSLLASPLIAQISQNHSVNASGMTWTQSNGSISFTVGEIVIPLASDSLGNSIGGGIISTSSIETIQVESIDVSEIDLSVYPNPTSDLINIKINSSNIDKFQIRISDSKGTETFTGQYAALNNSIGINMHAYPAGIYMLSIQTTTNKIIATYRIVKN